MKLIPILFDVTPGHILFEWILYLGPNIPENAFLAQIDEKNNLISFVIIKRNSFRLTKMYPKGGKVFDCSVAITSADYLLIKEFFEILKVDTKFDFEFSK